MADVKKNLEVSVPSNVPNIAARLKSSLQNAFLDGRMNNTKLAGESSMGAAQTQVATSSSESLISGDVKSDEDVPSRKKIKLDRSAFHPATAQTVDVGVKVKSKSPELKTDCDKYSSTSVATMSTSNELNADADARNHGCNGSVLKGLECKSRVAAAPDQAAAPLNPSASTDTKVKKISSSQTTVHTEEDMSGNTICTNQQRASPHVSPCNSDDEDGGDLILGATSTAEEDSEGDGGADEDKLLEDEGSSASELPARLSSSGPAEGRLKKLINHLTTTLGDETTNSQSSSRSPSISSLTSSQPNQQTDATTITETSSASNTVSLQKQMLELFYERIIKADVLKGARTSSLEQKYNTLHSETLGDTRKIDKVIQEVRTLRNKLKLMRMKPAHRSVSTQIDTAKVAIYDGDMKIIKSTGMKPPLNQQAATTKELPKPLSIDTAVAGSFNSPPRMTHAPAGFSSSSQISKVLLPSTLVQKNAVNSTAVRIPENNKQENRQTTSSTFTPKSAAATGGSSVIDLTADDDAAANQALKPTSVYGIATSRKSESEGLPAPTTTATTAPSLTPPKLPATHPAPLPPIPLTGRLGSSYKPPSPTLELRTNKDGLILQWNMALTKNHAPVSTYQIFGYKEKNCPPLGNEWKKVGDLKALPLPMACTLTQFQTGFTYHFAVRAVDDLGRTGPFSSPRSIRLS